MDAEIVFRFAACGAIGCLCVNLSRGARQRTEGGGTFLRYFWVCAVLAIAESMPLFIWWLLAVRGQASEGMSYLAWAASAFACIYGSRFLGPPLRLRGSTATLPLAEAPGLVERIQAIASRMKIPTPRIRLLANWGGTSMMLAWAGGLVAPSVAVTGGLLARLPPGEADAIIAHELAHIATGSLWFYPLVAAISATAALLSSRFMPEWLSAAWGLALFTGLSHIVSRQIEIRCDRCAARSVGHRTMYLALSKIHIAHPLNQSGRLAHLAHAVSTHPSPATRLNAIWRDATPDVQSGLNRYAREVRRDRIAASVACALWLIAILLPWTPVAVRQHQPVFAAVLLLIACAPLVLFLVALWRQIRIARRRRQVARVSSRFAWTALFAMGIGYALMSIGGRSSPLSQFGMVLMLTAPVLLLIASLLERRDLGLRRAVESAVSRGDFARARELYLQNQSRTRDPRVRHMAAVAAAVLDDRDSARSELAALIAEGRGPAGALLSLGMLQLTTDPARALEYFEAAVKKLPGDDGALGLTAWALCRLNRFEEADAQIQEAIRINPREGWFLAVQAEIALRRGDLARAEELVVMAFELDPGGEHPLLVEAWLRLARGESAEAAIDAAIKSATVNPFSLLGEEIDELRKRQRLTASAIGVQESTSATSDESNR